MRRMYGISKIALRGTMQRPMRSFLTMLACAISIASVIATVSITRGANRGVRSSFTSLGTHIVVIQNKANIGTMISKSSNAMMLLKSLPGISDIFESQPINLADAKRLSQILKEYKADVTPAIIEKVNVVYNKSTKDSRRTLVGVESKYFDMLPIAPVAGRLFTQDEVNRREKLCVLDEMAVCMIYPLGTNPKDVIGKTLIISDKNKTIPLRIVGVLKDPQVLRKKKKDVMDVGRVARSVHFTRLEFINIYAPLYVIDDSKMPQINAIFAAPKKIEDVDSVEQKVKTYMSANKKGVFVWAQKKWIFSTVEALEEFLSFSRYIWMMIMIVAIIMIVTITLVSVRERYYEIAIRMREGATKVRIMLQFALESLYLSTIGGIVGIILGFVLIRILRYYFLRWESPVEPQVVLLAFAGSFFIGILTSIPTAKRAASLNPVDVFRMH